MILSISRASASAITSLRPSCWGCSGCRRAALTAQLADQSLLSLESKAKIAHKLRGSALSVGAGRVAQAAWRIEELAAVGPGQAENPGGRLEEAEGIAALLFAVSEAVAEINRILG